MCVYMHVYTNTVNLCRRSQMCMGNVFCAFGVCERWMCTVLLYVQAKQAASNQLAESYNREKRNTQKQQQQQQQQ